MLCGIWNSGSCETLIKAIYGRDEELKVAEVVELLCRTVQVKVVAQLDPVVNGRLDGSGTRIVHSTKDLLRRTRDGPDRWKIVASRVEVESEVRRLLSSGSSFVCALNPGIINVKRIRAIGEVGVDSGS